jgi:hypothetical protein
MKVDSSEQGASSSGIPRRGADSISQPGDAEKTTEGRDSPLLGGPDQGSCKAQISGQHLN